MEITLPSGHKVTLRDSWLRGDRRAAQRAMDIRIAPDGSRNLDGAMITNVTGAVLQRMIVAWDLPGAIPRDAQTLELAQGILDTLDDDDYDALVAAVRPYVLKALKPDVGAEDPKPASSATGTSTSAEQDGQATLTM